MVYVLFFLKIIALYNISVMTHELGHFICCKILKVSVTEFYVGAKESKYLFKFKIGTTTFGIKRKFYSGGKNILGKRVDEYNLTNIQKIFIYSSGILLEITIIIFIIKSGLLSSQIKYFMSYASSTGPVELEIFLSHIKWAILYIFIDITTILCSTNDCQGIIRNIKQYRAIQKKDRINKYKKD